VITRPTDSYNRLMKASPVVRVALPEDVELITRHRHEMFRDNKFASDEVLEQMDEVFAPWLLQQLIAGRYFGLLVEDAQTVVAGAGIFFSEFPPHWRHTEAIRAYILNVYTEPSYRGLGLAKLLMKRLLDECRQRDISTVVLHASPQGRPIYEALGFVQSDEMIMSLTRLETEL